MGMIQTLQANSSLLEIKARILVVEDDETTRQVIMHILGNEYDIRVAENGRAALEAIDHDSYDLVLLDVMMPQMNGIDALTRIREQYTLEQLPVILLSALSNGEDIVVGLNVGANDYILKPCNPNVLLARVQTHLKLKFMCDERERSVQQIRNAEVVRAQLFRITSHDLKNPLNNIRMAEHVLRERHADPITNQILDSVLSTVHMMQGVIDDFMDLVELQTGHVDLKLGQVDVHEVLMQVLTQYEIASDNKQISIVIGQTDGVVTADHLRLIQVVSNLMSNAIKFSPYNRRIVVWTERRDMRLRICIQDEGPGIKPEERPMLFKEFSRLSNRPTGNESSTGLGLWIVDHLMRRQGGEVGVSFPENGGSIFWIELPAFATSEHEPYPKQDAS